MTSRGKSEGCRICGCVLQGNQRRWLYAAQNRKGGQPQTPTDFSSRGSLPRSAQSSPWGSTVSLSSSRSLSKSRGLLTPTKGIDLLCVLTHILDQTVPRGDGQGEFICGKCVSILERVFKFDTVIARVRALSGERLQKLTQERDKIRRWVRNMFDQRNPLSFSSKTSSSEDETDKDSPGEGYREMLKDNMALSEFEWWSEKAESCAYYRKTGKPCHTGKKCEGCDCLRVSDSDYESVCGVPRHLPEQAFETLGLSREKSNSMPLHWSRAASVRSSPASLSGSCHSLQSRSRTTSVKSLDSVDGADPFDWPEEHLAVIDAVFKELRGIEGKPVRSPAGSRIPVLRAHIQNGKDEVGLKAGLVRVLNFGEGDNGLENEFEDENNDILTELKDDFMPLQRESNSNRVHLAVKQLREQLVQAQAHIRTLEAQLKDANKSETDISAKHLKSPQPISVKNQNDIIQSLSQSLHSRESVIQDCVSLIQKLCAEKGVESKDTDKLIRKLASAVDAASGQREAALESQLSEAGEREKALEKQLQAVRDASRDREADFIMLNTVLQCNQDVIGHLRVELVERDRAQQEMMKEWGVWKERDSALMALVKENEDFISQLKAALESSCRDVQALSDSLIGRGLDGGGAEAGLANQLREKDALLTASFKDREELSNSMLQEMSRLSSALTDAESLIMEQRENHKQAITALSGQLKDALQELREKSKEKKEAELGWRKENKERVFEEGKLRDNLQKRDKLIEQVLLELEERDGVLTELQQNISGRLGPKTAFTHNIHSKCPSHALRVKVTMLMKQSVQTAPPAVVVGSQSWRDASVRSILRAEDLLRRTYVEQLHATTRYRCHSVGASTWRHPRLLNSSIEKKQNEENKVEFQPKSRGSMLSTVMMTGPFPPLVLREQSAMASTGLVGDYMRGVREVEGHLRRQAGRITQEGTRVEHLREQLEKLLRSLRRALLVNQQSADGRTFRPATAETVRDGADSLLISEKRGLSVLKHELENMLKKISVQQQSLAESSKQLLDCAHERSKVTELLPQHGSLLAGVKTYPSPLSLKPDPAGPFTPESKQALDSSSSVLRESQQLQENIRQLMSDVIRKQTDMHNSTSEALLKKITETVNLQQHLTLSSAATRQALYRKQRQMQCAGYSLGRAMGPICSADLFCRERLNRPMTQTYERHPSQKLPESALLTQGGNLLRKHLESSGKEITALRVTHRQLQDDLSGKRLASSIDASIVRLRRRLVRPQPVRPATS
ncbi:hypothetical protein DNTS_009614 [Danionella cerebrum]|uniref:Short myomegalin-like EB1 binding protein N-terminal domain-containing protein n=1 Tax=Danionella cerebrum TaxID=2873325 RepID=A0A553R3J1_9TELE|nr:hypothetical protein DNTS_009614 [Danionella translucida]